MPPRGVEKGVSQESPHFSFPEATMVNIKMRVGQKPRHLLFPEVGRSSQEKLVIIWHTEIPFKWFREASMTQTPHPQKR